MRILSYGGSHITSVSVHRYYVRGLSNYALRNLMNVFLNIFFFRAPSTKDLDIAMLGNSQNDNAMLSDNGIHIFSVHALNIEIGFLTSQMISPLGSDKSSGDLICYFSSDLHNLSVRYTFACKHSILTIILTWDDIPLPSRHSEYCLKPWKALYLCWPLFITNFCMTHEYARNTLLSKNQYSEIKRNYSENFLSALEIYVHPSSHCH